MKKIIAVLVMGFSMWAFAAVPIQSPLPLNTETSHPDKNTQQPLATDPSSSDDDAESLGTGSGDDVDSENDDTDNDPDPEAEDMSAPSVKS